MKRPERVAAVDKIEEKRKPDDFIGHRNRKAIEYAGVVELADTYDLGSYVVRHAGSSPVIRTKEERNYDTIFIVAFVFLYPKSLIV